MKSESSYGAGNLPREVPWPIVMLAFALAPLLLFTMPLWPFINPDQAERAFDNVADWLSF